MTPSSPPRTVAVVGSGVAGLTAAWVASRTVPTTLFEADDRLGGHADTHQVATGDGFVAIDTGFIVHNERTYPTLRRLFAELGVQTQESEMSLSVCDPVTGLEYAGALGPRGLFPSASQVFRPGYLRMLIDIPRFHRRAKIHLAHSRRTGGDEEFTLREFATREEFSDQFLRDFLEPLVAAVWSCEPSRALDYPAAYLFAFLEHHGMLGIFGSPIWRTVVGGSRTYVEKVAAGLDEVLLSSPVVAVAEANDHVAVTTADGKTRKFDSVVIATHPAQTLAMLQMPTPTQQEVLGAIGYSANRATLHSDTSLLPAAGRARASWNFRRRAEEDANGVLVTYDLTRLMRLPVDDSGTRYLVTLGGEDLIDPATVIAVRDYEHPLYTPESVRAQQRLNECNTDRIALAGAWQGWGFHEDGARSGLAAATALGLDWPDLNHRPIARPGIYATEIHHTRRKPWLRTFRHRSHLWLVDLDAIPDHGIFGTFEARDHFGDPDRSLSDNVHALLADYGIERPARVLMATQARALGWCFNPISVFWCLDRAGDQLAVVVEVHNTYAGRHAYVLHPDAQGRARTTKQLYVSPFHGTDGNYRVSVPTPQTRLDQPDRLFIGVDLVPDTSGDARFSTALIGTRLDDATHSDVRRAAWASLRTSVLIHAHGVWLWLRRLPVRPRPHSPSAADAQRKAT